MLQNAFNRGPELLATDTDKVSLLSLNTDLSSSVELSVSGLFQCHCLSIQLLQTARGGGGGGHFFCLSKENTLRIGRRVPLSHRIPS